MKQWYALYTKLRAEKRVVAALQQHGMKTFLPLIQSKPDGQHYVEVALFPGYVFVHADLEEEKEAHWKWVPGVRHLVSYGDMPAALPDRIINALKREAAQREAVGARARLRFTDSDVSSNTEVSFEVLLSNISRLTTVEQDMTVLLAHLDRISRIQVDPEHLELATPEQHRKRLRRSRGHGRIIRSQGF